MSARRTVLFRLEAGPDVGMGHLVRGIALARALGSIVEVRSIVATQSDGPWVERLNDAGIEHRRTGGAPWSEADEEATVAMIQEGGDAVVVTDYHDVPNRYLSSLRQAGARVVCIDDVGSVTEIADLIVNGSLVEPAGGLAVLGSTRLLKGPDYMILDPTFADSPGPAPSPAVPELLLTMGGSDPHQVTPWGIQAMDGVEADFTLSVVLGAAFAAHGLVRKAIREARHPVRLHRDVQNMSERFRRATLVLTAGGVTLYEACACGVPALVVSQNEGQLAEAEAFADRRAAISLGLWPEVEAEPVCRAVAEALRDVEETEAMAQRAAKLVDGRGAHRVAEEMVALWS